MAPICPGSPCVGKVQSDVLPEVPMEMLPLTGTAKRLQEMSGTAEVPQEMLDTAELPTEALPLMPSPVPGTETGTDPYKIKLPPWLGKWGTCPDKVSVVLASPPMPAEEPSQSMPQQNCLIHNWQGERVVDPLNSGLGQELDSKDFTHKHGYHGLPLHQFLSSLTASESSTVKDTYRLPHGALLLGQGQRKATLASMLYKQYSKETVEEISPPLRPMESVSTTHQDYCAKGFQPTPLPITQPHNYLTEQPTSFWLEQACSLPGVTSIFSRNIPFQRNAAFSTPITMYIGPPQPFDPLSSQLQPHEQ